MCRAHRWLVLSHAHLRFQNSIRSTSTCDRNVSACIGLVIGRFLWSVILLGMESTQAAKQRYYLLRDFRVNTFNVVVGFVSSCVRCRAMALAENFV